MVWFRKFIPKDINLTPTLLKNWIYGDGTLGGSTLRFCCDSFSKSDVDWVIERFLKDLTLKQFLWVRQKKEMINGDYLCVKLED